MTWGQGLYLPSWIERKPEVLREYIKMDTDVLQWTVQQDFIDNDDIILKDGLSFTGIVSKELNRICVKNNNNGGSNIGNLAIIKGGCELSVDGVDNFFKFENKDLILIFQFTSFGRDEIIKYLNQSELDMLFEYSIENVEVAIKKLLNEKLRNYFIDIHNTIETFAEKNGFEFWYLDWFGDFCNFMPEKFIDIKLRNGTKKYFAPLINTHPITIEFEGKSMRDSHINSVGNKILAESILEWLRDKSRGVGG